MDVKVNDVVQLDPSDHEPWCSGVFMLVTEVKSWGVMGFVSIPGEMCDFPGRAYYRATHGSYHRIGAAEWVLADDLA